MTRRALLLFGLVVLTLTGAGTAWGFWTGSGSGTGSAATGTLAAPTPVTVSAPAGAGTASVSWTASARATGYTVTRVRTSDGATAVVCSTTTATSCNGLSVPDGTYRFVVTAVAASWTASASSADVTVYNDRPTVTVNQATGQADPARTAPLNFTAVFSEPVTDFTSAAVAVSPASATVVVSRNGPTYTIAVSGLASSSAVTVTIPANAVHDTGGAGNTASTTTDNTVTYDATAPTAAAPTVTASLTYGTFVGNAAVTLTDTATDDFSGVASVTYYRCTGATGTCSAANWTAIGSSTATTFAFTTAAPFATDGSYRIVAVATDAAGNFSAPSAPTAVTVDTTPPTTGTLKVNGFS